MVCTRSFRELVLVRTFWLLNRATFTTSGTQPSSLRYRTRWRQAKLDPRYAGLQYRLDAVTTLAKPIVLVHGQEDQDVASVLSGRGQRPKSRIGN